MNYTVIVGYRSGVYRLSATFKKVEASNFAEARSVGIDRVRRHGLFPDFCAVFDGKQHHIGFVEVTDGRKVRST